MNPVSPATGIELPAGSWPARTELALVALIFFAAVTLRVWQPARMAVEHFDEGVYASNLAAGAVHDYRFPKRHLYAPPLLPALAEWSQVVCGRAGWCMMSANLLAGCLTVALTWWVARQWFGQSAGLAAAALSAMSDFHVLYTRTLLTDPLLGFWMLLAVYLTWKFYRQPALFGLVFAGLATALAWWTKYNGWLPLAVGLAGLLGWMLFERPALAIRRQLLFGWFGVAAVACVAWSPVLWELQPTGGYAAVAANHRGYLVGLSGWFESLVHQRNNLDFLSGWLSRLSPAFALLAAYAFVHFESKRSTWKSSDQPGRDTSKTTSASPPITGQNANSRAAATGVDGIAGSTVAWAAALVLAASVLFGSTMVLALAGIAGVACQLLARRDDRAAHDSKRESSLATWLLAAWFVGLLLSTPLYRPYPRIALPWLMAAWLGTAAAIGCFVNAARQRHTPGGNTRARRQPPKIASVVVSLLILAGAIWWKGAAISSRGIPGWQDRTGLHTIAANIVADTGRMTEDATEAATHENVFYIYAEPSLFFHLAGYGVPAAPVADLSFVGRTARPSNAALFLLTGPHARHDPAFLADLEKNRDALELVATYDYAPSDLVLLNRYAARQLSTLPERPVEQIRMFRLK